MWGSFNVFFLVKGAEEVYIKDFKVYGEKKFFSDCEFRNYFEFCYYINFKSYSCIDKWLGEMKRDYVIVVSLYRKNIVECLGILFLMDEEIIVCYLEFLILRV